jgi:hypothetical protein
VTTPVLPFTQLRAPNSTGLMRWLLTGENNTWWYLDRRAPPEEVWAEHRDAVVAHYAKRHPGQRPQTWWRYSAPEKCRHRLGGVGTPLSECTNSYPTFMYGIPEFWRRRGDFFERGTPLSEVDPPMFESEPTYLKRLGLLLRGESRRIARAAWAPVVVRICEDRVELHRVMPS